MKCKSIYQNSHPYYNILFKWDITHVDFYVTEGIVQRMDDFNFPLLQISGPA